jgi:Ser/Thr protein kinase RdoA (MazF antagonist)
VLADGANIIVHLKPAPVVAKVAASTPVVRPDGGDWLQRELDVSAFLAGIGIAVATPSKQVPAVVQHTGGHVMSFWDYLESAGGWPPDEVTIGSMLRELHAALRSYRAEPPVLAPLGDIPAYLSRPQTRLSPAEVSALRDAYARLTAEVTAAGGAQQVLHGDAGAGNLMSTSRGWVWHDFEDTCRGPIAWDLAASTGSAFRDGDRVLAAYGADSVDPDQLHTCEQLRRLHLTVWYSIYAERLPECRSRAAELLATWQA